MRKKVLLLLLCLLVVAGVSFAIGRQAARRFPIVTLHRMAEEKAQDWMGRKMQIRRIDLTLFPPSLALHDIAPAPRSISALQKHADIRIETLTLAWAPLSLFKERLEISKLSVSGLSMVITPEALREKPFVNAGQKQRVMIGKISIKEGRVIYRDVGHPHRPHWILDLHHIKGAFAPHRAMHRFPGTLSSTGGTLTVGQRTRGVDLLDLAVVLHTASKKSDAQGTLDVQKARLVLGRSMFEVHGTIPFHRPMDMMLSTQIPLEEIQAEIPTLNAQRLGGLLKGQWHLTGLLPHIEIAGEVSSPALTLSDRPMGTLKANITYRPRKETLVSLSGTAFSGSYHAEGHFTEHLKYRWTVKYKNLLLDQMIAAFPAHRAKTFSYVDLHQVGAEGEATFSNREGEIASGWVHLRRRGGVPQTASTRTENPLIARLTRLVMEGFARWTFANHELTFNNAMLRLPGSRMTGSGQWHQEGSSTMAFHVESEEMQPLAQVWHIPASGRMRMDGELHLKPEWRLSAHIQMSDWTLRGKPAGRMSAQFVQQGKQLAIEEGIWQEGKFSPNAPHYRFRGEMNFLPVPEFRFLAKVTGADPQFVLSFFKKSIPLQTKATGMLAISGARHAFHVTGPLTLRDGGTLYAEPFHWGRLRLTVTDQKVDFDDVVLKALRHQTSESRLTGRGQIRFDGSYRVEAGVTRAEQLHFVRSRLPMLTGPIQMIAKGEGTWKFPQMMLTAHAKKLRYGAVSLGKGHARLHLAGERFEFNGNLAGKKIQWHAEGRLVEAYPFSFEGRFSNLQWETLPLHFAKINPFKDITATGKVTATGHLKQRDRINLAMTLTALSATLQDYAIKNDGPIDLHVGQGVFTLDRTRLVGQDTALMIQGSFVPRKFWNLFINGEANLNLLSGWIPGVASGRGVAKLDMRIVDEWSAPNIHGTLAVKQGLLRTKSSMGSIYIGALSAVFNKRMLLIETLYGRMGGGTFDVEGRTNLVGFRPDKLMLQIALTDMTVPVLPDLSATVSGPLSLEGTLAKQSLSGALTIRDALYKKRVDVKTLLSKFTKSTPDPSVTSLPFGSTVEMKIVLGGDQNIGIQNNVAQVALAVDMELRGTLTAPILLGRIEATAGHLYFQDNDFEIRSGALEFLSLEKMAPVLNLEAFTHLRSTIAQDIPSTTLLPDLSRSETEDYRVDISLSGPLSELTVQMASTPPLPEKDVRAFLSGEATSLIASEFLEWPLRQLTGIDRVRVVLDPSQPSSPTRLVAEKRLLNDRASVVYSTTLGTSDETPRIRMIYNLAPHISLVGEQDEKGQKGGDIRFRFYLR